MYACHRYDTEPTISVLHHPAHGEHTGVSGAVCRACCGGLGHQCTEKRQKTWSKNCSNKRWMISYATLDPLVILVCPSVKQ